MKLLRVFTAYTSQKHTALAPDAKYLAVGSTDNSVAVLRYPSLEEVETIKLDTEVVDLDWGGEGGSWVSYRIRYEPLEHRGATSNIVACCDDYGIFVHIPPDHLREG